MLREIRHMEGCATSGSDGVASLLVLFLYFLLANVEMLRPDVQSMVTVLPGAFLAQASSNTAGGGSSLLTLW